MCSRLHMSTLLQQICDMPGNLDKGCSQPHGVQCRALDKPSHRLNQQNIHRLMCFIAHLLDLVSGADLFLTSSTPPLVKSSYRRHNLVLADPVAAKQAVLRPLGHSQPHLDSVAELRWTVMLTVLTMALSFRCRAMQRCWSMHLVRLCTLTGTMCAEMQV